MTGPVLGHPLTQAGSLGLPPLALAGLVAAAVAAVGLAVRAGRAVSASRAAGSPRPVDSWDGSLSAPQVAGRVAGVALLALSVAAGRLGADDQIENLAPALVVGAGWPLLVLGSALLGPLWRWLDPWDAMARPVAPAARPAATVAPAVVGAVLWTWYLNAYPEALSPRSAGAALGVYTIVTVAGCLALGRRRWLSSAEPFGIFLGWVARLPRRQLPGWDPPRGAALLLGGLAGGLAFGLLRRSELWISLNSVRGTEVTATLWLVVFAAAGAGLVVGASRLARRTAAPGCAEAAMVPAVAATAVALAMVSNRLFTSLQLLPALLGDPFGRGWDLLGAAGRGIERDPLGVAGLAAAQLVVLAAGHLAGAVVLARRAPRGSRWPGLVALVLAASITVAVVGSPPEVASP